MEMSCSDAACYIIENLRVNHSLEENQKPPWRCFNFNLTRTWNHGNRGTVDIITVDVDSDICHFYKMLDLDSQSSPVESHTLRRWIPILKLLFFNSWPPSRSRKMNSDSGSRLRNMDSAIIIIITTTIIIIMWQLLQTRWVLSKTSMITSHDEEKFSW